MAPHRPHHEELEERLDYMEKVVEAFMDDQGFEIPEVLERSRPKPPRFRHHHHREPHEVHEEIEDRLDYLEKVLEAFMDSKGFVIPEGLK